MKLLLSKKRMGHLKVQRNLLASMAIILLMIVLLQSVLLFFKKERIIINPPELKQGYWVEGNSFSKSYLEEMALFFSHLLLDVTEANVLLQGEVLLRYVKPESFGQFKAKLLSDERRLKKQQLSLHFMPGSIEIIEPLTLDVTGSLISYVGSQRVSQVQETYRIVFSQKNSRLFLDSFAMIKSSQESFDEPS